MPQSPSQRTYAARSWLSAPAPTATVATCARPLASKRSVEPCHIWFEMRALFHDAGSSHAASHDTYQVAGSFWPMPRYARYVWLR